jgi:hypothetical protein
VFCCPILSRSIHLRVLPNNAKVGTEFVKGLELVFPTIIGSKTADGVSTLNLALSFKILKFFKTLMFVFHKINPHPLAKVINKGDEVLGASHRCGVKWTANIRIN